MTKLHFSESLYKRSVTMSILGVATLIIVIVAAISLTTSLSAQTGAAHFATLLATVALVVLTAWFIAPFARFVGHYLTTKPTRARIKAANAAASKATLNKVDDQQIYHINAQPVVMYAKGGFVFTLQYVTDGLFVVVTNGDRTFELRPGSITDVSARPSDIQPSLIDMMTACMNAYGQDVPIDDGEGHASASVTRPTDMVGD